MESLSCCINTEANESSDDEIFRESSDSGKKKSACEREERCRSVIDSLGPGDRIFPRTMTDHYSTTRQEAGSSIAAAESSRNVKYGRSMSDGQDAHDALLRNVPTNDALPTDSMYIQRMDFTANMPCHIDAEQYNTNHKERGKCVVFNQEIFDMGFDMREGSSADAQRIARTFGKLGFTVIVHDNLPHTDVIGRITELSREDHTERDCICIFVLTHGLNNDMICARDVAYRSDSIWKPFTADKCKSLAGKPKLFFFQACRGEGLDGGVILKARHAMRKSSETDAPVASYKIPTHADFLIAHSSAQGFFSWRNPEEGTWYVKCLCDVFDEYADKLDLAKMLTITARKVATEYASVHDNPTKNDQKQVPSTVSMLIRDLYFSPKP